jgi:hypothetical protein
LTDGIKALMRRCDRLPDNMSGTEFTHYAGEVIKRLKRGASIEGVEVYLRSFMTRPSPLPGLLNTRELAERIVRLFKHMP